MDICWEIAKEAGKVAWAQLTYSQNLQQNLKILRSKIDELGGQRNDIMTELHRQEMQVGKKRKKEVNVWLRNVKRITNDVRSMETELQEGRSWSRCNLGMLVTKKVEEVVELQEKHKLFNGLVLDHHPDTRMVLPTVTLIGETTAKQTLGIIWECLINEEVGKIGIHGMGGVGKTTIMKHIHNRLIAAQNFDNIIWVSVSKAFNLKRLQIEIAKAMELNFLKDEDDDKRSKKLFDALARRKRFVLILDDMWKSFSLEKIGIPEPCGENGCKLIITTRDLKVCRQMESQRDITVGLLSEEEAWELFQEKIGGDIVLTPCIQDVAKRVADECSCLPLTIVTVGRYLRHENDVRVWTNMLNDLKYSSVKIKSLEEDVFKRLKFSYDRLSDEFQAYFLYCALYPKYHAIPAKELIEYWIWEGLINEMSNKEDEINKGLSILSELKYAHLLEGGVDEYNVEYVKMHKLVRDLAIDIARTSRRFMIKSGIGLKDPPEEGEWQKDIQRISLMCNSLEMLSGEPSCPEVSTLLLQHNCILRDIPQSFFQSMHGLKILNLSYTNIESLPVSISNLKGLRALLLGSCWRLKYLPSLEELTALRVLDLSSTLVDRLPQGLERFSKLRCLDLSWMYNLQTIQAGIVSKLLNLEDLQLYGNGWRLTLNFAEATVEEITSLVRLENLSLHFSCLQTFSRYIESQHWQQLKQFSFVVGPTPQVYPCPMVCSVELEDCDLTSQAMSLILPGDTSNVRIRECQISRLSELMCLSNLKKLKECEIYKCYGMECILMAKENILLTLEKLDLWELPCLKAICDGVAPHYSLANLRHLEIEACHGLKSLFSLELLQKLFHLEVIKVKYCWSMVELVGTEERVNEANNSDGDIILPNLKTMSLIEIPGLRSISNKVLVCDSLTTIILRKCPQLENIHLSGVTSELKGEIQGNREWWESLGWACPNTKALIESLFKETSEGVAVN